MKNILLISLLICFSSNHSNISENITDEQYKIINDLFSNEKNKKELYTYTDYSKTWAFTLLNYESLKNLLGPPCTKDGLIVKWENIFSNKELKMLRDKIAHHKVMKLDNNKLSKNISLKKTIDDKTIIISVPEIINNYSVVKISGNKGELIIVAKKVNNKWEIICRKWVYQVIDD
ncbi:hypothetical protein [Mesoflavibacter sp. CH_XMU1404-2]|uniref:hypothetical protein n=1 Tax=Mesoflavibacter sp. CH_XMU1404-2 TaxID=3107766 RepID=UPI00300B4E0C